MSELNLETQSGHKNTTFYINMYRRGVGLFVISLMLSFLLACVILYVAINPHKTRGIIATIDGRYVEPNDFYFKAKGIWKNLIGRFL